MIPNRDPFAMDEWLESEGGSASLPPLDGFTSSESKALRITNYIETSRRTLGFAKLAGNFDGCGISFGVLQWNVKTGSLQPLLKKMLARHPERFDAAFGDGAAELRGVLRLPLGAQLAWARRLSVAPRGKTIHEPWRSRFFRLGADPAFQRIELEAIRPRMNQAVAHARRLGFRSERALALMFDLVTQQGGAWHTVANRSARIARGIAQKERERGRPLGEREKLLVVAEVIAATVKREWREKVWQRKRAIVLGRGPFRGGVLDVDATFGLTDQPFTTNAPAPAGTSREIGAGAAMVSPLATAPRGLRSSRRRRAPVFGIVVHTTGAGPAGRERKSGGRRRAIEYALDYYVKGREGFPHYVIDYGGDIYATADERTVAWHAGIGRKAFSGWTPPAWWSRVWSRFSARSPFDLMPPGTANPNEVYIGVELLGARRPGFTDAQYRSLARLVDNIRRRHRLDIRGAPSPRLLGHEDLNPFPSAGGRGGRADSRGGWDPGAHRANPYFRWERLWRELQSAVAREMAA